MRSRNKGLQRLGIEELLPLIEKSIAGERSAMEQLIETINLYVTRRISILTRGSDHSADIAQNVLIKVFRRITDLKKQDRFFGWLERIMRNEVYDYSRAAVKISRFSGDISIAENNPSGGPDQFDAAYKKQMIKTLGAMMEKLSVREQMAFYLREYEEMNADQIALAMDIKPSTARVLYNRAGAKLAAMLPAFITGGEK